MRDLMLVMFTSNNVIGIYHGSIQAMSENPPEIIQAGHSLNGEIPPCTCQTWSGRHNQ